MSDQFSIDSKVKEVEALFSSIGFSFNNFEPIAFENACKKLEEEKGLEAHVRSEPTIGRAKITMPDGTNYQVLYDGELHVS